ncbi:2653_t:CDS:2 [Dentiscutata heterogama]|uniref:2653_t:CDS:1 n=1 Tax=Dentiscutata heterogama TaxID=1316150 RepID=A0ACA9L7W0_9GLOM|nr:2653_t:CDS:2 [Dentiscutata heterogama]
MSSKSALSRAVTKKGVPRLLEFCYKKLISHKHLGKAPYYLLKRVLRHCTPDELRNLEEANPHLMDEDMELWKDHYIRAHPNSSRNIIDSDNEDWRQLYWRSKEEQEERLASWQKMTPLQKLRRNYEKNDYYRPVFKQQESSTIRPRSDQVVPNNRPVFKQQASSTIRPRSDQIGLKNNLRHEPYPTVGTSQRKGNSVVPNNNSKPNSRPTLASSRTSIPVTKATKAKSGSTLAASRTPIPITAASNRVVTKKNTTKPSDNSHVIKTKSDVRQKLYPKTHYDIQNAKTATIKSSKHLKPKRVA